MKRDKSESEMIRRQRLGDLRKLLRHRCRHTLPNDDAGREYLFELLLPIATGPNADIKMRVTIELWAPWVDKKEAGGLIDRINRMKPWERMPDARLLGDRLLLVLAEREMLRIKTIKPYHMTDDELALWRKHKNRERMKRQRQARLDWLAQSISQTKPWIAAGYRCRRTWERHGKPTVAGVCRIKVTKAEHTLATPTPLPLSKVVAEQTAAALTAEYHQKAERPKKPIKSVAHELHAHTCDTSLLICTTEMKPPIDGHTHLVGLGWRRNAIRPDEQLNPEAESQ